MESHLTLTKTHDCLCPHFTDWKVKVVTYTRSHSWDSGGGPKFVPSTAVLHCLPWGSEGAFQFPEMKYMYHFSWNMSALRFTTAYTLQVHWKYDLFTLANQSWGFHRVKPLRNGPLTGNRVYLQSVSYIRKQGCSNLLTVVGTVSSKEGKLLPWNTGWICIRLPSALLGFLPPQKLWCNYFWGGFWINTKRSVWVQPVSDLACIACCVCLLKV